MDAKGPLIGGAIVLVGAVAALAILGWRAGQEEVADPDAVAPLQAATLPPEEVAPPPASAAAQEPASPAQPLAQAQAPPPPVQLTPPAAASIAGAWHDGNHLDYVVEQQGNRFILVSAMGPAAFAAEGVLQGNQAGMQGAIMGVDFECSGAVTERPQRLTFDCLLAGGMRDRIEFHRPGEG